MPGVPRGGGVPVIRDPRIDERDLAARHAIGRSGRFELALVAYADALREPMSWIDGRPLRERDVAALSLAGLVLIDPTSAALRGLISGVLAANALDNLEVVLLCKEVIRHAKEWRGDATSLERGEVIAAQIAQTLGHLVEPARERDPEGGE